MTESLTLPSADPEKLPYASLAVFQVKQGEMVALMVRLGNLLGLFQAMADGQPTSAADLAALTDLKVRWVQEWLYAVTAAGLAEHPAPGSAGAEQFHLTPEMSAILAQPDHPSFAGDAFGAAVDGPTTDRLAESFRTGVGFSWGDHGEATAHMQASMSGPRQRHFLVPVILASIDGLIERLESGIRVVDAGCGSGVAACVMAEAFPNSSFLGIDPSTPAITAARQRAADLDLSNLRFEELGFGDIEPGSVDFLSTLDVIHDLPRPAEAVHAARAALADDGVWLVADIKAESTFAANRKNPVVALFYAMSVAYCMNSALSEEGGAGLGTLGLHPERLRGLTEAAGFTRFEFREFPEDVSNRYFEIRP